MRLDTEPGERVKFTCEGGYPMQRAFAQESLTVGEIYIVDQVDVGNWESSVKLTCCAKWFNTVLFENVEDEDIASDDEEDRSKTPLEARMVAWIGRIRGEAVKIETRFTGASFVCLSADYHNFADDLCELMEAAGFHVHPELKRRD